jgi:hypothetical protein
MSIKYSQCAKNIFQSKALQNLPKLGFLVLKIIHLATLTKRRTLKVREIEKFSSDRMTQQQVCQTVCFRTKNPNFGKFWRFFQWKMVVYFMETWSILQSFGIFYDHLVHFVFVWYIFFCFGILYLEKSGNLAQQPRLRNKNGFERQNQKTSS